MGCEGYQTGARGRDGWTGSLVWLSLAQQKLLKLSRHTLFYKRQGLAQNSGRFKIRQLQHTHPMEPSVLLTL